jgi:cytochrome c oxidase cbb3-type subunit 3
MARRGWALAIAVVVVVVVGVAGWRARHAQMEARFMSVPATEVERDPALVRFAAGEARPVFRRLCAECHGQDLKGKAGSGAPNLADHVWLYGDSIYKLQQVIYYGVRMGHQRSVDIADMPAYGQRGQLSDTEIRNLVQYLFRLSGRPYEPNSAAIGRALYFSAQCDDCHSADAKGNIDYGATDFTANVWDYGGDADSLYQSIYFGRRGVMPAQVGKLSMTQLRALAVYVKTAAKR